VPELTARRVVVEGRVQGVFFRDSCRREAVARDVAGWVRNRAGGRVEALFEGDPDAVEAMIDWCRRGPPAARVDRVEVSAEPPQRLSGFAIVG
jgi:acylphosphatase